jgi:hypothetical protein
VQCSVGPRLGGGGGGYAEGGKHAEGEKVRKRGRTRIAEVRAGANMRAAIVRKGVGQGSPVPHLSKKVPEERGNPSTSKKMWPLRRSPANVTPVSHLQQHIRMTLPSSSS